MNMKNVDRWLLPDGVEEILPEQAWSVEQLRRRLVDLYHHWGYELVIPPLIEFTESLFSGVGSDLELLTLKVTDQLSGRMMGLRADMTPQAARMDAHSFIRKGVNRLCYTGHVLHAKPQTPLATRTPLQAGVELFGESTLNADIEVISLLIESLLITDIKHITLGLGHVGIYRALMKTVEISSTQETAFFALLQSKDQSEIQAWITDNIASNDVSQWLMSIASLSGDQSVLVTAKTVLNNAPTQALAAIDELIAVTHTIGKRYPSIDLYFDLSELRGYHYHTGMVFAAYTQGYGDAIANGGRYDHIGKTFGRSRTATGFSINLTSVINLMPLDSKSTGIYAPASNDIAQWQAIQALRAQGERVVCGLSDDTISMKESKCDRQLLFTNGQYKVKHL